MSKTVNQLNNLANQQGYTEDLNDIYNNIVDKVDWPNGTNLANWKNKFKELFSLNDFLLISHQMSTSDQDYVSFKVPLTAYEAVMHSIRLNALSSEISASLKLGQLAWEDDLHLGNLAHLNSVTRDLITGTLTEDQIETTWGDLHSKNYNELELSALAHKDKITDNDVAVNAKINCSKIAGLGNLATADKSSLNLSYMASRPCINLGLHKLNDLPDGEYDVIGKLDQKYIDNPYKYTLPAATNDNLGGLKTGFNSNKSLYAVKLTSDNNTAYVDVPWTDNILEIDKFEAQANGKNKFTIEFNYTIYDKSAENKTPDPDPHIITKDVTIVPSITKNIVLSSAVHYNNSKLNNSIAIFGDGSGNTDDSVKIGLGPKIYPETQDEKYLKINGTWSEIPEATADKTGLLTYTDKRFIDELRNKGDYTLPAATNATLGGIRIPAIAPADHYAYYTFPNEEGGLISLPLRVTSNREAYVNIPARLGNQSSFNAAAADAASTSFLNKLKELYPVGSIYITTAADCPLKTLIKGSNWPKIEGRYLLASGPLAGTNNESYSVTAGQISTVEAAIPNHSHYISVGKGNCTCQNVKSVKNHHSDGTNYAYVSGIAGFATSQTVRPPAFVVNVFIRTA